MLSDFHDDVVQFYSPQERAEGRIKGHDRSGLERYFPLLRCSIGVIELPQGLLLDDVGRVSAEIAAIKASSKESEGGLVFRMFGGSEPDLLSTLRGGAT